MEGRLTGSREHRISSINGDLRLGLTGGYSVNVRAVSGSITSQVPMQRADGQGQRRVVVGDGHAEVTFRTVSGDLVLREMAARPAAAVVPRPDQDEDIGMRALLESLERGDIDVDEASRRLGATRG